MEVRLGPLVVSALQAEPSEVCVDVPGQVARRVVLLDYRERAFVKRFGLAALSLLHVNRGEVVERVADQKVFAAERLLPYLKHAPCERKRLVVLALAEKLHDLRVQTRGLREFARRFPLTRRADGLARGFSLPRVLPCGVARRENRYANQGEDFFHPTLFL